MGQLDMPEMPVPGLSNLPNGEYIHPESGMTIRQHAAITLRVPMSGDTELDAMIREARRLDMATAAMHGFSSCMDAPFESTPHAMERAVVFADTLLASCEPKKAEPERCATCDGTGDVHSADGEWLGECKACTTQPDAERWIEWRGGECPVPAITRVAIKLRNNTIIPGIAGTFAWEIIECGDDIIAYRVVKEAEA